MHMFRFSPKRVRITFCLQFPRISLSTYLDQEYCIDLVKTCDFENYLCGLLVPKHIRRCYFTVKAFNVEIAQVRDQSRNNFLTGRLRFQFWRESIEAAFNHSNEMSVEQRRHPIVRELSACVQRYGLTKRYLEQSVEARLADFAGKEIASMSDLEWYAESSQSSMLYLLLEALGIKEEKAMYAASHAGCCAGIVTLLRGFPLHIQQKQLYFPEDLIIKHGLSKTELQNSLKLSDKNIEAITAITFEVAAQAYGHLERVRYHISEGLPTGAIYALLPAVQSHMFLANLEKENFNIIAHRTSGNQLWYQMKLLKFIYLQKL